MYNRALKFCCHLTGLFHGCLQLGGRHFGAAHQRRLDHHRSDVGEAHEAQDELQVTLLVIGPLALGGRIIPAARVSHKDRLADEKPAVPFFRRKGEGIARLNQEVNVLLEPVLLIAVSFPLLFYRRQASSFVKTLLTRSVSLVRL